MKDKFDVEQVNWRCLPSLVSVDLGIWLLFRAVWAIYYDWFVEDELTLGKFQLTGLLDRFVFCIVCIQI